MVATESIRSELRAQGLEHLHHWSRGVDLDCFSPDAPPPPEYAEMAGPILLYVGRVAVEKNLEAFLACEYPGTKVIVGDGPARADLERRFPDAHFLGKRMIVPRGGRSLVERVQADARVPVLAHLDGLCHTYIHDQADPAMASEIAINAKMRRTGICGAMETLLIDARFGNAEALVAGLIDAGCEVRGDDRIMALDERVARASDEDWDTEYLDSILSVAMVDDLDHAMAHIAQHSSNHTDAIITEDPGAAERFLNAVDSAIVMHNASTQYADGGEFGLGAEIGIATGRLHEVLHRFAPAFCFDRFDKVHQSHLVAVADIHDPEWRDW